MYFFNMRKFDNLDRNLYSIQMTKVKAKTYTYNNRAAIQTFRIAQFTADGCPCLTIQIFSKAF